MTRKLPDEGARVRMRTGSIYSLTPAGSVGTVTGGPGCDEDDGLVCVFWGDDLLPTAEVPEDLEGMTDD